MKKTVIDKFFEKKGIKTRFNTLGYTDILIRSYLKDFQSEVDGTYRKKSEDVKHSCYNKIYPVKSRPKFTGFETLAKQDSKFRKDIGMFISTPQFSPLETMEHICNNDIDISYKDALKDSIKNIDNPIVYLSGGLDSEIVANAFVDTGKSFIPLIYYYVDDYGNLLNKHDIGYAYAFCKKHGLFPVIKQLNVPKLWHTEEFKKLAIDLQIVSPQLVTYAYMIQQMSEEYPDHTHVFGGEVKFKSNYQYANRNYNLVFLDKLVPAYDGQLYGAPSGLYGEPGYVALAYYGNTLEGAGTWEVQIYTSGFPQPYPTNSGVWTTTPALGPYEVDISAASLIYSVGSPLYFNYEPKTAYTQPIGSASYYLAYAEAGSLAFPYGQYVQVNVAWTFATRVVGEVSPVIYSSIELVATAEYT